MHGPICVFHCVTILGTLSRACLMKLLVGVFGFIRLFLPSILSVPCSLVSLLRALPSTLYHCVRVFGKVKHKTHLNSIRMWHFVLFFSVFFFLCWYFRAFWEMSQSWARANRERDGGEKRPKKHCHWTFKSIWIRRPVRVLSTFAVLVCLFVLLSCPTVVYVVVVVSLCSCCCCECALSTSIVIQKWLHYLYSHFFVFLVLSFCSAAARVASTRNVIHASIFIVVFVFLLLLLLFLLSFVLMGCILFYVAGRVCNTSSH